MRTELDRWLDALSQGWVELLMLFGMLVAALTIIGWCYNRGFRPADRGPVLRLPVLIICAGLVVLLQYFRNDLWPAIIIGSTVLLAGFISRNVHPRGLWLPIVIMSALLGLGLHLSAVLLAAAIALAALFSGRQQR